MNILQKLFPDRIYLTGIILTVFSTFIFNCASLTSNESVLFATFCVNYLVSIVFWGYLIILFCSKKWRKTVKTNHLFPALVLSLISAYALNRLMCVFEQSAGWFSVLLVTISVTLLALPFFHKMNKTSKIIVLFLTGIGFSVFLYLSFYLLPIYIISIPLAFGFGVSLHTFVPLIFCICILIWMRRNSIRKMIFAFVAGLVVAVSIAAGYSIKWNHTVHQINATYHNTFAEDNAVLPAWVRVAQRIEKNAQTNKILKINLVYKEFDTDNWFWGFDNFAGNNYSEQKLHDPLVIIASLFSEPLSLNTGEKINILRSIYDSRHQAVERLWSGDDLHTTFVNSFVQLYPEYRLAYTENVVSVCNRSPHLWSRQEAVYTFRLPQGSVATSLSLWINGLEEKAILTSKEKAENAYKTIVGREMRDPSLVLWQEGNTLLVRVFPVEANSERTFKIGIT
ncbi:MAG: XrtN system VIT domain-containing protein, partial [Dysgonamonadaceae bacterium]|nr:XrtN system VIT domain-containing protein [Dysgonamonadaceae bacterium]